MNLARSASRRTRAKLFMMRTSLWTFTERKRAPALMFSACTPLCEYLSHSSLTHRCTDTSLSRTWTLESYMGQNTMTILHRKTPMVSRAHIRLPQPFLSVDMVISGGLLCQLVPRRAELIKRGGELFRRGRPSLLF